MSHTRIHTHAYMHSHRNFPVHLHMHLYIYMHTPAGRGFSCGTDEGYNLIDQLIDWGQIKTNA